MPRSKERMTKAMVLEEMQTLRKYIKGFFAMSLEELDGVFKEAFPADVTESPSREYMISALIMSATYHMTNVLNLE